MNRVLIVTNSSRYILQHQIPIARAARAAGLDVALVVPQEEDAPDPRALGFPVHHIRMDRCRINPLRDAQTLIDLVRLYRRERPTLVHHVTIKPTAYGTLAARIAGVPAVLDAWPGGGFVFTDDKLKTRVIRQFARLFFRAAFAHPNHRMTFLNPDDRALFIASGVVAEERTQVIRGVGVDLDTYFPAEEPPAGPPVVLLAARMLWQKGVGEFVEAARTLKDRGVPARFVLVGGTDAENPGRIDEATLREWEAEGLVEWWGYQTDMPAMYRKANIFALPSYREGLPVVLTEAAACGLPIVASDAPGCREFAHHEDNALVVPAKDAVALADALQRLIEDGALRERLARTARAQVVKEFSFEAAGRNMLGVYRRLLTAAAASSPAVSTVPDSVAACAP